MNVSNKFGRRISMFQYPTALRSAVCVLRVGDYQSAPNCFFLFFAVQPNSLVLFIVSTSMQFPFHSLTALLAASALSACSLAAPRTQAIQVRADSPSATIYVNGKESGKGSCLVVLPSNKTAVFKAIEGEKQSTDILLKPELSICGITDLASWWLLFPLVGLTSPGAWHLPQDTVPLHIPQNQHE